MKIGFISDVHANLPALEAVLNDLQDVDRTIHAGDIVGYNGFPKEVIGRFQDQNIDSITGNHDQGVIDEGEFDFPSHIDEVIDWTANEISTNDMEYINELEKELLTKIDNYNIQVVHGSPFDSSEYIYPTDITLELVEKIDENIDILVWGHTHYPVVTKLNGVLLMNPGSVGQPRDGDWRASYSIFNTSTGSIEIKRREYDVGKVVKRAKSESFNKKMVDSIRKPD